MIAEPTLQESVFETAIERSSQWLLKSGVQITSDNPQHDGGFACWYEADTGKIPYVYSEITGYLVNLMCVLWEETHDLAYLNSAIRAGDWLFKTTHEPTGGFRCLFPLYPSRFDYKHEQIYTFDCGVILNGLVNLYRATRNARYLTAAVAVGEWLVNDVQKSDGGFYPVYEIDRSDFVHSGEEWSLTSGSYHTKVAIGLANLYDISGRDKYLTAVTKVCDYALTFQQTDGRFRTFQHIDGTNCHPHAYSAEGLWVIGNYLGREDYLQASLKATEWLLNMQSTEGFIPRHYQDGQPFYTERVDIQAQTLRLGAIHLTENRLSKDWQPKLEKLIPIIMQNQAESDDTRINGAFYFGRLSSGERVTHANVWVTAFTIQALSLYRAWQQNTYRFSPFSMV